jgi:hypothetical protein
MFESSGTLPIFAIIFFLTQGMVMAWDEFYFHFRRGLKPWETWGHPADTLVFLACFLLASSLPAEEMTSKVFMALAVVSTLMITKDEWVHKKECCANEQWLHALLFILHPISLWLCYQLWHSGHPAHLNILRLQTVLIGGFLVYQLIFWQAIAHRLPKFRNYPESNPLAGDRHQKEISFL